MKNIHSWAVAMALAVLAVSCGKEDEAVSQPYENGVFITHEGAFSGGTGTVSFYNRTVGGLKNDIFAAENKGAALGNILQSMTTIGGKTYLVVNNANKIIITDAGSFKFRDSIGGTTLPRYIVSIDDKKAFLSEWGANGIEGSIKILDLTTKKFTKTIPTGKGAGRMLRVGNTVWVTNDGGFDKDSTVAIVDVTSEMVTAKINVGVSPNSLVQDASGDIWVLAGGHWSDKNGKLTQIRNNAVINSYSVPQGASALTINTTKNILYFIAENAIFQKDLTSATPSVWVEKPTNSATFGSLYGLGLDPKSGYLYLADAKNYSSAGIVYIFNNSKVLQDSLRTGIIPSNFWFQ